MAGGGGALRAVFTASHALLPFDVGGLAFRAWGGRRSLAWGPAGKPGKSPEQWSGWVTCVLSDLVPILQALRTPVSLVELLFIGPLLCALLCPGPGTADSKPRLVAGRGGDVCQKSQRQM